MVGEIQIRNVKKKFENPDGSEVVALDNVNFSVKPGSFISLIGPSGCGKTTLLRAIAGLNLPDEGAIYLDGKQITGAGADRGYAFQQANLFPWLNIRNNVAFGLRARGEYKAHKDDVDQFLEMVGLQEFAKSYPHQISGGMCQRAALARALVGHPKVLLLDEPLGALDLQLRRAMQIELKHLQKKLGITFIYITHDQEEAINMSDRIAVMKDGRIEQIGTPDEIYNHPKTSYVATFVGNANILHGVAESIQGENAIVKIGNDRVIVKLETSQQDTEDTGAKQYLSAGEKVTLAVRSENILLQEAAVIGDTDTDNGDAVDISVADGGLDAHNKNSVSGLQATVTEKNFAGGQLRVTLKLRDGTQLIASRYGIDASVAEGQTVRCSFLPTDAVLVDREDIHEEA